MRVTCSSVSVSQAAETSQYQEDEKPKAEEMLQASRDISFKEFFTVAH